MSELGPNAKQLVDAGRKAFKPTEADRQRVLGALLPQLGASIAPAPVAPAQGFGQGVLTKLSLAVIGVGVVGGGLMLALPSETPIRAVAPRASVISVPTMEAILPTPQNPAPTSEQVAEPAESAVVRTQRSEDWLAEEVEILSRAGAALRGGHAAVALKALEEHQRRFPSGVLAQERSAARVQALCALGRNDEGLRELRRLERAAPGSPHLVRAKKACDAPATP